MISHGFPNGLAARGTCGQAVEVGTLRIEHCRQVSRRHIRFLLKLFRRVEQFQAGGDELRRVIFAVYQSSRHHFAKGREILVALATAQVDPKPNRIADRVEHTAVGDRLLGRADSEFRMPATVTPQFGRLATIRDVPVLDLGADFGGESAGIEKRCQRDTALSFFQPRPHGGGIMPHGIDHSNSGNNNAATHRVCFRDEGKTRTGYSLKRIVSEVLVHGNWLSIGVDRHMKKVHQPQHGS